MWGTSSPAASTVGRDGEKGVYFSNFSVNFPVSVRTVELVGKLVAPRFSITLAFIGGYI